MFTNTFFSQPPNPLIPLLSSSQRELLNCEQQFPLAGLVVACGGLEPLGWECSDRSGERSPRSVALC